MKVSNTPPGVQQVTQIEKMQPTRDVGSAKKADADLRVGTTSPKGADVQISEDARLFQKALDLVKSLPEPDKREKIAALKSSISSGTYRTDSASLAERLLDEHMKNDFGKNKI
jgi:flagellar biosynthesis anti-sigma factor FlgM